MNSKWWTHSWNPVVGCTPASPGCDNCYAKALHDQRHAAFVAGSRIPACYAQPFGQVTCLDERLARPLGWKRPRRVFVNSMGDLFHPDVPFEFLDRVFAVMALASQHTFIICTKRAERMREYVVSVHRGAFGVEHEGKISESPSGRGLTAARKSLGMNLSQGLACVGAVRAGLPNVWLGVTAENQEQADARIPILLDTPAARRFVSIEPVLGPVDLQAYLGGDNGGFVCPKCGVWEEADRYCATCGADIWDFEDYNKPALDWVICGGESGPNARPMHPDWSRRLRDQCAAAGVPFFFKQWGELTWLPVPADIPHGKSVFCHFRRAFIGSGDPLGRTYNPDGLYASRSRRAGRLLDGVEHNAMPEVLHA